MSEDFKDLIVSVRQCSLCADVLPNDPKPILQVDSKASLLIVGQAPGQRVHDTGVPFNDPSGDRLRDWLGIDRQSFYNSEIVALLPMAFCFPGSRKGGDLPPPKICAETWRNRLLGFLSNVELTVLCGAYAISWHLPETRTKTLTHTVRHWRAFGPHIIPLPHPSGRNNGWIRRNQWFEAELIPHLRRRVASVLSRIDD